MEKYNKTSNTVILEFSSRQIEPQLKMHTNKQKSESQIPILDKMSYLIFSITNKLSKII